MHHVDMMLSGHFCFLILLDNSKVLLTEPLDMLKS